MLSAIALLALTLAMLGLLLGFAASFDAPPSGREIFPSDIGTRDPEIQNKLVEDCIKDAKFDGGLDEDEYNRCAYGVYG